MKFNDVSFPHPVLGVGDSIKGKFGLSPAPIITSNADAYSITVNCEYINSDLYALVNSGHAEFLCEATCSNTLYRQIFIGSNNEINLRFQRNN